MVGEEVCQVCQEPHSKARPLDLIYAVESPKGIAFTGLEEVLRQDHA